MKLVKENGRVSENPTPALIARELKTLKNGSKHTYAILEGDHGDFLQVAGGGIGCVVEKKLNGKLLRAYSSRPSAKFVDGTLLSYSGGRMPLRADEWFSTSMAAEVFTAFLMGAPEPAWVQWRPHNPDATPTAEGRSDLGV